MPFRKPKDPEALERWRVVQRARKVQRKEAAKADPRFLALKKAAKERQQAAYEKARERTRAAIAEAKKRQRATIKKAKELAAAQREDRLAGQRAERDAALLRKFVRPASTTTDPGSFALSALTATARPTAQREAQESRPSAMAGQLAFANLTNKAE
jgi:hypothetical protein